MIIIKLYFLLTIVSCFSQYNICEIDNYEYEAEKIYECETKNESAYSWMDEIDCLEDEVLAERISKEGCIDDVVNVKYNFSITTIDQNYIIYVLAFNEPCTSAEGEDRNILCIFDKDNKLVNQISVIGDKNEYHVINKTETDEALLVGETRYEIQNVIRQSWYLVSIENNNTIIDEDVIEDKPNYFESDGTYQDCYCKFDRDFQMYQIDGKINDENYYDLKYTLIGNLCFDTTKGKFVMDN